MLGAPELRLSQRINLQAQEQILLDGLDEFSGAGPRGLKQLPQLPNDSVGTYTRQTIRGSNEAKPVRSGFPNSRIGVIPQ